jgi:hypothetical protein
MLVVKERRPTVRTIEGWAISVLHEAGAIRECEEHGWMKDPHRSTCPGARYRNRPTRPAAGSVSGRGDGSGPGCVGFDRRRLPRVLYAGRIRILFGVVDECHWRSLGYAFGDTFGIPIGETNAAVRFRFGHPSGEWGALDAAAVLGKIDPHRTDGICSGPALW